MKKGIQIFLALFLILNITACSSQNKDFQDRIDSFVETYREAEHTDDALKEDIQMHLAVGHLQVISQMYEDSKNQENLNSYLDKKISKEMFDKVYEYNKTCEEPSEIEEDLIEHYN